MTPEQEVAILDAINRLDNLAQLYHQTAHDTGMWVECRETYCKDTAIRVAEADKAMKELRPTVRR